MEQITIEDIITNNCINRDNVVIDEEKINKALHGKNIMVTGAAGSIGSEICRQVLHYKPRKTNTFRPSRVTFI